MRYFGNAYHFLSLEFLQRKNDYRCFSNSGYYRFLSGTFSFVYKVENDQKFKEDLDEKNGRIRARIIVRGGNAAGCNNAYGALSFLFVNLKGETSARHIYGWRVFSMTSKFRVWLLIVFVPSLTGLIVATVVLWIELFFLVKNKHAGKDWPLGLLAVFFTFLFTIIFREIRFKWSRIRIQDNLLVIERFFGLGRTEIIDLKQLTGFTRSIEPSRVGSGETINLYRSGIRILEVSDTPYNNIAKIYRQLTKRTKNLGYETFSFTRTIVSSLGQPIRWTGNENAR